MRTDDAIDDLRGVGQEEQKKTIQTNGKAKEHPGWALYRKIGSPQRIAAPMVDQSELPFRLLCRHYGAQLCYTPMIHAACFVREKKHKKRLDMFYANSVPEDRPLIAQFCGNDPNILLQATKLIEDEVDAVDLNLGCPQGIARKGKYGAFLLTEKDLLVKIVSTLSKNLKIPVTCKIRLLPSFEQTLELCHALVGAGCQILTVHGRTKEQNKSLVGECDWPAIKRIREALPIPVFANGGISNMDDVEACLEQTGVAGVMSSEALLENPGLFSRNFDSVTGQLATQDDLAKQYLELVDRYPPLQFKPVRAHLFKLLFTGLQVHTDLRSKLSSVDYQGMKTVVAEMEERRIVDTSSQGVSWYWRYWSNKERPSWLLPLPPPKVKTPAAAAGQEGKGGGRVGGKEGEKGETGEGKGEEKEGEGEGGEAGGEGKEGEEGGEGKESVEERGKGEGKSAMCGTAAAEAAAVVLKEERKGEVDSSSNGTSNGNIDDCDGKKGGVDCGSSSSCDGNGGAVARSPMEGVVDNDGTSSSNGDKKGEVDGSNSSSGNGNGVVISESPMDGVVVVEEVAAGPIKRKQPDK